MNKYKISIGINIILLLALIVCIFLLTRKTSGKDPVKETVIEKEDCINRYCFSGLGVRIFPEKRLIRLGEEYKLEILLEASVYHRERQPIVVIGKDTFDTYGGNFLFKEKPQKRGLVEREGRMIYFHPRDGAIEFSFKFNYTVK